MTPCHTTSTHPVFSMIEYKHGFACTSAILNRRQQYLMPRLSFYIMAVPHANKELSTGLSLFTDSAARIGTRQNFRATEIIW